ncbi:MAG: hypothetical protein AAFP20_13995 [Cyanobacteria bacterium J06614_10]
MSNLLKKVSMQNWKSVVVLPSILLLSLFAVGCSVEQTREGELPDVDVDVQAEPGQLPQYDVEGPDVDVETKETTVEVPEVEVTTEEKTIEVPTLDVDLPGEEDAEAAAEAAE